MTEQSFDLGDRVAGGLPVIEVSGEVDLATAPLLRERLESHLEAGATSVVVDLRATTFLDSTGLGVLVTALKRCRESGGELHLVAVDPRLLKLFAITGLQDTFSISDSVETVGRPASAGSTEG